MKINNKNLYYEIARKMYKILKITKKLNGNFNLYIKDYKDEKVEVHLETLYSYKLLSKKEMDENEFEDMLVENEKKLAKRKEEFVEKNKYFISFRPIGDVSYGLWRKGDFSSR